MAHEAVKLWEPTPEQIANSNMMEFMEFVNKKFGTSFKNYEQLYNWSITEIENFWLSVWEFGEFSFSGNIDKLLEYSEGKKNVAPGAEWFKGIELNFAENLLSHRSDDTAIIEYNESGETKKITYKDLYAEVTRVRQGLVELGVVKGDRVAGFVSNISEAVIGMLASTSIGAVWSSCSPDFGFQGVLDRFLQIQPKVLIAVDGYIYNGKTFSSIDTINCLLETLDKTDTFIIIPKINADLNQLKNGNNKKILTWKELNNYHPKEIEFERLAFGQPVYIMYSSGTTGKPKCIVHGAGGTLLQHFKELKLHSNLKKDDTIFFFTTCGWMMWNWLVSSLKIGATVFLYDGSPAFPERDSLWKAAQDFKINIFGTSPKFLSMCEKSGLKPGEKYNIVELKTILSTGAPLTDNNFKYVYENIKSDVQLASISGGTDIISCFMLGNPILPVYSGEIQSAGLGMKIESWDETGKSLIGQKGELVCTEVFPSMPVFFWDDENNKLYNDAYFDYFQGVWRHGDFIEITERGGVIVFGRSDATLNPGGVRIGTAEIYRVVEANENVSDSLIVTKKINGEDFIILFIVIKEGMVFDGDLEINLKLEIRKNLTPRHVPHYIKQIFEVPVTLNGKKVEIAVTKILNGESVGNRDALANPESLEEFVGMEF